MMGKILASTLIAFLIALALPQRSIPTPVTVSELIAHPADHYDQHLTVKGILKFNTSGALICEFASRAGSRNDEACIDIADANSPIGHFDWSKKGALVSITGYFSHTCPNPDLSDKDGIRSICLHRGWRGYINVESLAIGGYATCEDDCAASANPGAHEVSAADPAGAGISEFAATFVSAARSRRAERIVAITLPSLRTETRFDLVTRASFDRYYAEMANAPARITDPGTGFRLFDVDKDDYTARHHELCFCVKGDCASRWASATQDHHGANFQCHYVWRDGTTWYLLY